MTRLVRALAQPPPWIRFWLAAIMLGVPVVAGDAKPQTALSAAEVRVLSQSRVPVILPRNVPPDLSIVKVWLSRDRLSYYVLYSGAASTLFAAGAMDAAQQSAGSNSRRSAPNNAALSRAFADSHVLAAEKCRLRAPRSVEIGSARYSYVACGAGAAETLGRNFAPSAPLTSFQASTSVGSSPLLAGLSAAQRSKLAASAVPTVAFVLPPAYHVVDAASSTDEVQAYRIRYSDGIRTIELYAWVRRPDVAQADSQKPALPIVAFARAPAEVTVAQTVPLVRPPDRIPMARPPYPTPPEPHILPRPPYPAPAARPPYPVDGARPPYPTLPPDAGPDSEPPPYSVPAARPPNPALGAPLPFSGAPVPPPDGQPPRRRAASFWEGPALPVPTAVPQPGLRILVDSKLLGKTALRQSYENQECFETGPALTLSAWFAYRVITCNVGLYSAGRLIESAQVVRP